jgi:putative transposase
MPGCWHHVTQRGNCRRDIFSYDADRVFYLDLLRRHALRHRLRITGYCLMTNHVHFLAIPATEDSLAIVFGRAHYDYARWFNLREGGSGHLWQNRYYSCPLDAHHRWEALRYVELNPVRAGVVAAAGDWPWSSTRAHSTGIDPARLIDWTDWCDRWSFESWREALHLGIADAALLERIREATRTGRPAGDRGFLEQASAACGRSLIPHKRGRKPKTACLAAQGNLGII